MNSQENLQSQECHFLQQRALKFGFFGDTQIVFLERFARSNENLTNKALAESSEFEVDNKTQKFQDELTHIYKVLKDFGCPIERQTKNKEGKGASRKGENPWQQAFQWLWGKDFYEWQNEQNRKMGADAAPIDWHNICQAMLNKQRQLTSNYLLGDYEDATFERKQIYVPLALVLRTKPDKRSGEFSPEAGTLLYEPQYEQKQRFEHEDFLTRILEAGQGKTNGKRISLIGEPGAGKTTLLQHIACWVLEKAQPPRQQENKDVAIWVSLAALQGRSLEEYLLQTWLKKALQVVHVASEMKDALAELFKSGRVWLLLDGVDEIALSNGDPRYAIAEEMTGWVASARVVLTCRLNVWQANVNLLAEFETYRLLDFDYPQQVHQFIDKWFATSDAAKGERLKEKLGVAEKIRLRDLVQNPLRLALLCRTWQSREGELPHTKAGLYHEFVQQFYDWKKHLFRTSPQKQQKLNSALGRLAKRDIDEGGSRFRLRESFIGEELGNRDAKKSRFHLALKLGWLNDVGIADEPNTKEKVYAFLHPTFKEYFAALAINDWHFFLNHILDHPNHPNPNYRIFEPQWKEVILLWLGREDVPSKQKKELIQALVEFDDGCNDFYHYRAYFLAAAGIAEFGDCSRVDEIVQQIVEWGFGYFDEEQKWVTATAIEPFLAAARAVLLETHRPKAITALSELIEKCKDEYIRWQAATSLLEIDPNSTIIEALVDLTQSSEDKYTRGLTAESLGNIHKGNPIDIISLIELLQHSEDEYTRRLVVAEDEYTRRLVVESLGYIHKGNPKAIITLIELLQHSQDEYIRILAVEILKNIAKVNPIAITALGELLQHSEDEKIRGLAASSLLSIDQGNPIAITALVELLQHSEDEWARSEAGIALSYNSSGSFIAINALESLSQDSQDEYTRRLAAESLGRIHKDNSIAINTLESLSQNSQNEELRRLAAESLGEIQSNNPIAIDALEFLTINAFESSSQNYQDNFTLCQAAQSLGKIDKDNFIAINTLEFLIEFPNDNFTLYQAAQSLGKIDKDNPILIDALVHLLQNFQDDIDGYILSDVAYDLKEILAKAQMAGVVTDLKNYLSNETKLNDYEQYKSCYEVVWHCAQTLPYPTFYQAWHNPQLSPHLEVPETISVGFSPNSQSLNLAELPNLLRIALDSNSDLRSEVQLICIDGSKFIDRDNPALKIYNEMRSHGCPNYWDGKPTKMAQLQDYWDELRQNSDRALVLVFYENSTAPRQGFSETFLDALSRFDGAICAIGDQPNIPLQSFSPNQPNLDINVVEWIRKIVLENP